MTHQLVIRLPVNVVVITPYRSRNELDVVEAAMKQSVGFWREQVGIHIQSNVRGWHTTVDLQDGFLGDNLHDILRWEIGLPKPVVYVFAQANYLVDLGLGAAWPWNGIAAVAGHAVYVPMGMIIDHELGHLLGLDHEEGTFMRSALETENRAVSIFQKVTLLENAYRLGGF